MTDTATPRLSRADVDLRPEREDDVPFLRYLYGTTREQEMQAVPWTEAQKAEFLDMQFGAQRSHYGDVYGDAERLVIEHRAQPIGRLYIDRGDDEIHILDIALLPQWRGRGLGARLLRDVLAEGEASGRKVTIYVEHFNPARHLYDRLGFRHVDTNGVYHFMEWRAGGAT